MSFPTIYIADNLKDWPTAAEINGQYVYARPMGLQGRFLKLRLKLAWKVFTGQADVLVWRGGQ